MVVNITYMMAVCQKHLSFLIVFGQDRVIFKDSLSNVFNLVKQSHGTLFFKGSPHGGQVNVVGEEKKQSCKIIFLINYLAGQAFRRGEEKSVSDSSIWLHSQCNLHVLNIFFILPTISRTGTMSVLMSKSSCRAE